jgi:hypothetical protein
MSGQAGDGEGSAGLAIRLRPPDPGRFLAGSLLLEALLVLAGVVLAPHGGSRPLDRLFDLDREATVAAWLSSAQLLALGAVLLLVAWRSSPPPPVSRPFLGCLGLGFVLLSMDEAAAFHERLSEALQAFGFLPRFKDGHGLWIFVYAFCGIAFLLVARRAALAAWRAARAEALLFAGGIAVSILGAIGLEVVSYQFLRGAGAPLLYRTEVVAEEFLEMAGVSIMLYAALRLWSRRPPAPA